MTRHERLFPEPRDEPFQLSRGWKLRALERVQLPKVFNQVSATAMHKVLLALDGFSGNASKCCVGERKLIAVTRLSPRQLRRGLRALEQLKLIEIRVRNSRRGRASSEYRINWKQVSPETWQSPPPAPADSAAQRSPWPLGSPDETAAQRPPWPVAPAAMVTGPAAMVTGPAAMVAGDLNRLSNRYSNRLPLPPSSQFARLPAPLSEAEAEAEEMDSDEGGEEFPPPPLLAPSDVGSHEALMAAFDRFASHPQIDLEPADRRLFVAAVYSLGREAKLAASSSEPIRDPYALFNWRLQRGKFTWVTRITAADLQRADRDFRKASVFDNPQPQGASDAEEV